MSKARLVITAVTIEKRQVNEVAKSYGVARSWVCKLLARYQAEGEAAFEPRSRRPKTSPSAISDDAADLIIRLRKELAGQGLDAGPQTIAWHLEHHHQLKAPAATVSRYLSRAGLVTPTPARRPKSSCIRFEADMPDECRQSDFTRYPLADETDTEILTWLDDHSLCTAGYRAHPGHRPRGLAGLPGSVRAARHPGCHPDRQRHGFHDPPAGRPGRPQRPRARAAPPRHNPEERQAQPPPDPGKSRKIPADHEELAPRPARPARRPRRPPVPAGHLRQHLQQPAPAPVPHRPRDPGRGLRRRPKAGPGDRAAGTHDRVRTDRIDATGLVTLRHSGKLHHIGIGRPHAGTRVLLLIQDLDIRVINADTGELIRELVLNPDRDYQPTGRPPGWPKKNTANHT